MASEKPKKRSEFERVRQEAKDWLKKPPNQFLVASSGLIIVGFLGAAAGYPFFWTFFLGGTILLLARLFQDLGLISPSKPLEVEKEEPKEVKESEVSVSRRALPKTLGKEDVLEQWNALIANAQGRAREIFEDTKNLILKSKAPDIRMEYRAVGPSLIRGLLGGRRPFLVISNKTNSNLETFRMYINARDYGENLQVSWYLVQQFSPGQKLFFALSRIPFLGLCLLPFYFQARLVRAKEQGLLELDLFDLQDLVAYVTNAHHCLLSAVEKLMVELGQDPKKIERKSRGFLGIS